MFFDTHTHLFDERFRDDLSAVLDRAQVAGVTRMLCLGIDRASNHATVALAQSHSTIWAAVGLHPNYLHNVQPGDWDDVVRLAQNEPRVVAIGETGLDRYWHDTPWSDQETYFQYHLELARRLNKPVAIHCRDAAADVVRIVREHYERYGPLRGIMHAYSGDAETARQCWEMGLHISFAGMVTYPKATGLRQVLQQIPLDKLLLETDSPYLPPQAVRGQRNEPAFLVHTARLVASLRNLSLEQLAEITTRNACNLFGLS
ncbi:MAG: TatD family hydrolase [Gemmataceae bacterium]|nr:TatD family hydrolase [Gemmataceae bacterium]MDW8242730.1 TatD family hydrolase [Thermogemmata sp.]